MTYFLKTPSTAIKTILGYLAKKKGRVLDPPLHRDIDTNFGPQGTNRLDSPAYFSRLFDLTDRITVLARIEHGDLVEEFKFNLNVISQCGVNRLLDLV